MMKLWKAQDYYPVSIYLFIYLLSFTTFTKHFFKKFKYLPGTQVKNKKKKKKKIKKIVLAKTKTKISV